MNAAEVIAALMLPGGARVEQRVPKKLLLEQGTPTAADKRQIQEGVEELTWIAALKPSTIGVPDYRDDVREYLEITVLSLFMRPSTKATRLNELIHRAVPYPVFLVTSFGTEVCVSLAHKRFSQAEAGATVFDGPLLTATLFPSPNRLEAVGSAFLDSIGLSAQPRTNLHALYQGWVERVEALLAGSITGSYSPASDDEAAKARRAALESHARLEREISGLRSQAAKEKQINRRVELNLTIQRLEAELAEASLNL